MIIRQFTNLYSKNGNKNPRRKKIWNIIAKCDNCGRKFEEKSNKFFKFEEIHQKQLCNKCRKISACSMGGKASANSFNSGRFTTERWNSLSKKEQEKQVKRANDALQEKLKDPEERIKHFKKIWKNSKIGYISKGQREVYDNLKNIGFELDGIYSSMKIDIINFDKKIAIEYNGDFWHCNPRKWKPEDYNNAIKMTAQEKWNKDRNRRFFLENNGFKVFVIWESDWKKNRQKYLERILDYYETCK